jgi:serpin B
VCPDTGRFDEITSHVDAALFEAAVHAQSELVDLTVQKFDIGSRRSLKQTLSALGMPSAFDRDRDDFGGITTDEPLAIDEVVHQANVTVDEQGTVAAAATAVMMLARSAAPSATPRELIVDRPFVFFLHDRPTGVIVFAGQVTDPSR